MAAMKQSLPTRIGVVALVSLGLLSATVTTYVLVGNKVGNPVATATAESPSGPAVKSYIDTLTKAEGSADTRAPESELAQLLPNHIFTYPGFDLDAAPLASGIVIGKISAVSPVTAKKGTDPDIVLTIVVDHALGSVAGETLLEVGSNLVKGQTLASATDALTNAGQVLIVLDENPSGGPRFVVRQSGALIAQIVDSKIQFMSMTAERNARFTLGVETVSDLETAASRPAVIGTVENGRASL